MLRWLVGVGITGWGLVALPAKGLAGGPSGCPEQVAELSIRAGWCASRYATGLGSVRQLAVDPRGVVLLVERGQEGAVHAFHDTDRDGRADRHRRFGPPAPTGIALGDSLLYVATATAVLRYRWQPGQLVPSGAPDTVLRDLPVSGEHAAKQVAIGPDGALYLNVGAPSDSCQEQNRRVGSVGRDPCPELALHAAVWRFAAPRGGLRLTDGVRVATGVRNTMAMAAEPRTGRMYGLVNGRNELQSVWGFPLTFDRENPAEELVLLEGDRDYGWPYCFHAISVGRKVLAPEYGGDGELVGRCAGVAPALHAFPAHSVPFDLAFRPLPDSAGTRRSEAFIAFRGPRRSTNLVGPPRDVITRLQFLDGVPEQQDQILVSGRGGGSSLRPTGVAVLPDGALLVVSDLHGTIWRLAPP